MEILFFANIIVPKNRCMEDERLMFNIYIMEKEILYVAPQVEIIEVEVEKGFSVTYEKEPF